MSSPLKFVSHLLLLSNIPGNRMSPSQTFLRIFYWTGLFSAYAVSVSASSNYYNMNSDPFYQTLQDDTRTLSFRSIPNIARGHISTELLSEFQREISRSYGSNKHISGFYSKRIFLSEVDTVFRIHMGITSSKRVLSNFSEDGINLLSYYSTELQVNQPFVQILRKSSISIQAFVEKLRNETSGPRNTDESNVSYEWVGGQVRDLRINNGLVFELSSNCREMTITYPDGRTEGIAWKKFTNSNYIQSNGSFSLIIYPSEHSSPLCGGDSLFFKDHPSMSQRLIRTVHGPGLPYITFYGHIGNKDLNAGRIAPRIVHVTNDSDLYKNIESPMDLDKMKFKLRSTRNVRIRAEKEFEHSLADYNNFGFLLLSIATLASSTIIAVVTMRGAGLREMAIVAVEAVVVLLFLTMISYILVEFLDSDDYVLDRKIHQKTIHRYKEIEVKASYRRRDILVGKNFQSPTLLIITEVCAVIATVIILVNLVRLFSKRPRETSLDIQNQMHVHDSKFNTLEQSDWSNFSFRAEHLCSCKRSGPKIGKWSRRARRFRHLSKKTRHGSEGDKFSGKRQNEEERRTTVQ